MRIPAAIWITLLIAYLSVGVDGATLNTTFEIAEVITTTGAPFQLNPTITQFQEDAESGTSYIYRIAIYANLSGLPSGTAFGDEVFNLTATSGLTRVASNLGSARPNWVGNYPPIGYDTSGNPVALMQTNADEGSSTTDLQSITVAINNNPSNYNNVYDDTEDDNPIPDARQSFANPGPTKLGTIDFRYDPFNGPQWLTMSGVQFSTLDTNPSESSYMQFGPVTTIPDGELVEYFSGPLSDSYGPERDPTSGSAGIEFPDFPEPTTLSLLGTGALLAACRRMRK